MKNITLSTYVSNGVQTKYFAAGLNIADNSYVIVIVSSEQLTAADFNVLPDFNIQLNAIYPRGTSISIYAFEEATYTIPSTKTNNFTTIAQTVYVADGATSSFAGPGNANFYIVAINGYIGTEGRDYDRTNNIIQFTRPVSAKAIIDITTFTYTAATDIVGGVSATDHLHKIDRAELTADGIHDTFKAGSMTSNKSIYSLVFINKLKKEPGIDYIVSHGRIKFNQTPTAGANITVISFNKAAPSLIPKSPTRVRYLDKDANLNERTLYRNYWREQISHYGMTVNYYTSLTNTGNMDVIYGEAPLAGYSEPVELNIAIQIDTETSMFAKFGVMTDTDATCYIHHDDFQEIFGLSSEPKTGDLIELTEMGVDRLNYPNRGPRIMEITDKSDEVSNTTNNLAGHYVWQIKLKRFDYSKEFSILPELGTKDSSFTGETVEGALNPIEELSRQVFDYTQNTCSNDSVYGDY